MWSIPELRGRILFTFAMLAVFRLGCFIPIPGITPGIVSEWMKSMEDEGAEGMARVFGFLNIFSGGAFTNISLFSLGIMPYISASIIFQLLVKVIPQLEALAKEGPSGYRKISHYTRLATVPICAVQALFLVGWLQKVQPYNGIPIVASPGFWFAFVAMLALTAGSMFVMWLGEQITEHGIGNGASILIMAGIVARMPGAAAQIMQRVWDGDMKPIVPIIVVGLYVAVVTAIVFTTQAQRRIPVQYARHTRGRRVYGSQQRHYLPLRVNHAGVMPVIFASSLMVIPIMFAQVVGFDQMKDVFTRQGFWYSLVYVILVIFFSYFWTALFFQPNEMANQLKEHGSFIPGIRPGKKTAEHLKYILDRVTLGGAAFLSLIALLPDLISVALGVDRFLTAFLGGTGILIVVGVGLDMMQKIESHLLMRQYGGFLGGGRRIRGRR
jgi:preprotein translocase subunit SecY